MPATRKDPNRPFAIQLEVEFLDRLSEPVREGRVKSVSDLIRAALARYDFANVMVLRSPQLLISVRLPTEIRQELRKISRAKQASIGQLVRLAVEAYLPQLEVDSGTESGMSIPHVELPTAGPAKDSGLARRTKKKAAPKGKRITAKKPELRKPKAVSSPAKPPVLRHDKPGQRAKATGKKAPSR